MKDGKRLLVANPYQSNSKVGDMLLYRLKFMGMPEHEKRSAFFREACMCDCNKDHNNQGRKTNINFSKYYPIGCRCTLFGDTISVVLMIVVVSSCVVRAYVPFSLLWISLSAGGIGDGRCDAI